MHNIFFERNIEKEKANLNKKTRSRAPKGLKDIEVLRRYNKHKVSFKEAKTVFFDEHAI